MRWQCQLNFKPRGELLWPSAHHSLRRPMHVNHMILSYWWWFPTSSKEMLCHDSDRPRGHTFPSGWVTRSYITLAVRYVQSTACLHCAVLLNLWCSTVDLSMSCFTVWPLPKPLTHNMKLCISFLIMNYVNLYSSFPGRIQTLLTSATLQSSCSETFISNSLHSLGIPLWFPHNEPVFHRDKQLSQH